jgi:hypothetical protein
MKDPDGYWWGRILWRIGRSRWSSLISPNTPKDWEDLLKPEYKGRVAMAGDVLKSNQSVQTVLAAGLARTGGDIEAAPEAGLQFWKEMVDSGNFIPVIADQGRIAQRETLIVMEWDYLALANRDALGGNPELEIIVPRVRRAGGTVRRRHQRLRAASVCRPPVVGVRHERRRPEPVPEGLRPSRSASTIWSAAAVITGDAGQTAARRVLRESDFFLSVEQLQASNAYITENWRRVVYGE